MARGNRRCCTTITVMSISLVSTDPSLTPRIGGESKNTRSYWLFTRWMRSVIRCEFSMPTLSVGNWPLEMNERLSILVVRVIESIVAAPER